MKVREVIEALSQLDPDAHCGVLDDLDLIYFKRIDVMGIGGNADVYFCTTKQSPQDARAKARRELEEYHERALKRRQEERKAP